VPKACKKGSDTLIAKMLCTTQFGVDGDCFEVGSKNVTMTIKEVVKSASVGLTTT